MPRNNEVLDRIQALEDEVRLIKQILPTKARLDLALARTQRRARGTSSRDIAAAADRAVRAVRVSQLRRLCLALGKSIAVPATPGSSKKTTQ